MKQYLDTLEDILKNGVDKPNRTGMDTRAVLGRQMRFHMREGFPLVTTKKMAIKMLVGELLGHIKGLDNAADYRALGSPVWDANANENTKWLSSPHRKGTDDLGRIYGVQWRRWRAVRPRLLLNKHFPLWFFPKIEEIDQLAQAINSIKTNPNSRYHVVTGWNPAELEEMALPPCPTWFHFFVAGEELSLHLFQRSCDMFLGIPFNIAQYSLLLHMVAQITGYKAGEFVHTLSDAHIYHNHFDQVQEQLSRKPYPLPRLWLNPNVKDIDSFTMDDIKLVDYKHHPPIKADMAV